MSQPLAPFEPHAGVRILQIRGQRVILDEDLAMLYGVPTRRLNEQVKRNADRFPPDFMFQLSPEEWDYLKSQFATSSTWGGRRKVPTAFTEHGTVMAASVLNSNQAIQASVFVVRAFVRMREVLGAHQELARHIQALERRVGSHDEAIQMLLRTLKDLMPASTPKKAKIGFHGGRP